MCVCVCVCLVKGVFTRLELKGYSNRFSFVFTLLLDLGVGCK